MNQRADKQLSFDNLNSQGQIRYVPSPDTQSSIIHTNLPTDTDRFIHINNTFPPKFAIVDVEDYKWLKNGHWWLKKGRHTFYVEGSVRINGKLLKGLMHRLVMKAERGQQVDHEDGKGFRNVKRNLRFCTPTQQRANSKARTPGTGKYSPYKGVTIMRSHPTKWFSQIRIKGKQINIGYFETELEAALAYDQKARELFGEFAKLNFPKKESV